MVKLVKVSALHSAGIKSVPVPDNKVEEVSQQIMLGFMQQDLILNSMRDQFADTAKKDSMDLVQNMSEKDKQEMRDILSNNLADGKGMRETAKELEKRFPEDIDRNRAESIVRTETTNVKNLANHEKYSEKGFQSFTVDFTADACDDCVNAYDGMVFSMDDTDMLPAYHPKCMCVAVFHEETPEELAEKEGLTVYGGGSGEDGFIDVGNDLNDYVDSSGWSDELPVTTETEANDVYMYQGDRYKDINYYMWNDNEVRPGSSGPYALDEKGNELGIDGYKKVLDNQIENINTVVNNVLTLEDMLLYSGVKESAGFENAEIGYFFPFEGFNSASTSKRDAKKYADHTKTLLEIEYPKGSPGLPVNKFLQLNDVVPYYNENEILLPGGQVWEVTDKYNKEGYNIIKIALKR